MSEPPEVSPGLTRLSPYVPRLVVDWLRNAPEATHREIEGSLAFLDISGFTRLTERLARHGQEGAEEMSDILNSTFSELLDVGYQDGAGLVKWGGDAMLLLFDGPEHASRAARAAFRMRRRMREVGHLQTPAGSVQLRMSAGIHSGRFHFFLVGNPDFHRELLVAGPDASLTAELESAAGTGDIAISEETAALIPDGCVGRPVGPGLLLRNEPTIATVGIPPAKSVHGLDLAEVLPNGIRQHLLAQPGEAEHRTISVGFVEFSGTDEVLRSGGPAALAASLHEVIANIQAAVDRYGVTFFESDINRDGGKVMLTAGAPISQGNDEDRLLRASRQIVEEAGRLPLRVGINRGGVFSGDFGPPFRRTYSVKGDAINLAARVMGRAEVGQVLATNAVVERSRTDFSLTPLPPFLVKGKSQPVEAFQVGPVLAQDNRSTGGGALIGRQSQLAALKEQVARAIAGNGSLTTVSGDRGSGRTRLVREVLHGTTGVRVIGASCDEYDVTAPYVTLRRVFREALGAGTDADDHTVIAYLNDVASGEADVAPWLPLIGVIVGVQLPDTPQTQGLEPEFRKPRMEAAAVRLLELLLREPTVIAIDDIHYLDDASHDLLTAVIDASKDRAPWAVVLTTRTGIDTPWNQLDDGHHIELPLLTKEEATQYVAAATSEHPLPPGIVDAIVARAEGNPFFLRSLLASAASQTDLEELPDTIEGVVTIEIDRLSPAHRRVLRYASVLGTTVDEELLEHMLGEHWIDPETRGFQPLQGLLSRGGRGQLQFRTALIRDVAYHGLPYRRRRSLHELAGDALLAARAGDASTWDVDRLARHFHLADRAHESWMFSRQAAQKAQDQFAHAEAARFFSWAVQAGRRVSITDTERAEVVEALGDAQYLLGLSAEARSSYQRAVRDFAQEPLRAATVHLKLGRLDQRVGYLSQSLRRLSRGMTLVRDIAGTRARAVEAELATRYSIGRFQQGKYRDAKKWGDRAVSLAEQSTDREVLANAHNALEAITLWAGLSSDVSHGDLALALYEELGDLAGQGHSLNNLAIRAIFEGRWDDTQPLLTRAAGLFEQIGDAASLAAALYNQGDVLVRQGRSAEAEPLFERALSIARSVDDDETVALVLRDWGKSESRTGRYDKAQQLLTDAKSRLEALGEPQELLDAEAALAECALLEGRPLDALEITDGALKTATEENASVLPTLYRVRGFAFLLTGDVQAAASAFDTGLELQSPAARHENAFLTLGRAEVARRRGEPEAEQLHAEATMAMTALGVVVTPVPAGIIAEWAT